MFQKGQRIRLKDGRKLEIGDPLGGGGQGNTYLATDLTNKRQKVLKIFLPEHCNDATRQRVQWLVAQRLESWSPALVGPDTVFECKDGTGHLSDYVASAQSLEEFLPASGINLMEGLVLAQALALAVAALHERQTAWGDPHANNVLIRRNALGIFEVFLIDFDNFNAAGLPLPPCVGHSLYMAPELRRAVNGSGGTMVPTRESDRFALGVMMHEIILLRHLAAGADATPEDFNKAMERGIWLSDPMLGGDLSALVGGYPATILDADLARMFRRSVKDDPSARPSPLEWAEALKKAVTRIYLCDDCQCPFLVDPSKTTCPHCHKPFPVWCLLLPSGKRIMLDAGATVVGRTELGGSGKVSARHAIFRRIGPEYFVENISSNGLFRKGPAGWMPLTAYKAYLLRSGDVLLFADMEVQALAS